MPPVWKLLLLMLPGLLLSLDGNSAIPIDQRGTESFQNLTQMLWDESDLTKLEESYLEDDAEEVSSSQPVFGDRSDNILTNETSILEKSSKSSPLLKSIFQSNNRHRIWGSHPIGTRESFVIKNDNGDLKWIAYFYDQAVAAVLQTRNGTMLKCTVQENIQEWEQKIALRYLGGIMPLRPLPFHAMVHLITICGTLNMPPPPPSSTLRNPHTKGSSNLWWLDMSALRGILPGTLWCGVQDRATFYHQLGQRQKVDSCCRAHDHCPIKLSSLTTRYGVTNLGIKTVSHCSCDLEFYRCLKAADSETARMVGQMYFNYLDMKCLDAPSSAKPWRHPSAGSQKEKRKTKEAGLLECVKTDYEGGCRKWVMRPEDFSVELEITHLDLAF